MVASERSAKWRTTFFAAWASIGILLLVGAALYALGRIFSALVPFLIAFVLAFLLSGLVDALQKRGMSRGIATLLSILGLIAVVAGIMTFIVPAVVRESAAFVKEVPKYSEQVQQFVQDLMTRFNRVSFPDWLGNVTGAVSSQLSTLAVSIGSAVATGLVSAGSGVATGAFDLLIGMVLAFWVLRDLPKMRSELRSLAGPRYQEDFENAAFTVARVVRGYLKGTTIASLVIAVVSVIAFLIIGVPYPWVLGVVVFFLNYIPYVGPFISAVLAGLLGLLVSPWVGLGGLLTVIIAQNVTDNLVTPRVMAEHVDLHPTLVIFSLLVGGSLFGIPGMLLAIPVAATAKGLFVYYYERRTQRQIVSSDGAFFRSSTAGPEGGSETPEQTSEKAEEADAGTGTSDNDAGSTGSDS
ncbi:MAG: AI-2E family transporter [Coriobacteriia bacterium]